MTKITIIVHHFPNTVQLFFTDSYYKKHSAVHNIIEPSDIQKYQLTFNIIKYHSERSEESPCLINREILRYKCLRMT